MKRPPASGILFSCLALLTVSAAQVMAAAPSTPAKPIRALIVIGGHDFETNQFLQVFKDNPEITFRMISHPKAEALFKAEAAGQYDVLVFYDMWEKLSDEAKADLTSRVKEGKGLLALHHSLCGYQTWDEYRDMIGGRYHSQKWQDHGTERPASTYKHDVDFKVHVADRAHPITRGVNDFTIHDETYGGFEVLPQAHVLLTTDEPTNTRDIAWVKSYGSGRVAYLQLGHDHLAYENPNYRRLVKQALEWVAARNAP
jgi:uncharacterized protein